MTAAVSMIVPYYRQPKMLALQLAAWAQYSPEALACLRFIIVDDCSPEPARAVLEAAPVPVELYRVLRDVPWNRSMARNLGSHVAKTPYLLHLDTDHILPPDSADALALWVPDISPRRWYKFRRFRVGRADDTRNKDAIPRGQEFGEIKPHVDSYLCSKHTYWEVGGYDEDYAGCLGGGGAFLRQLAKTAPETMAPPDVHLHVYTRDKAPDSSISTLSRDTAEYSRRRRIKERAGNIKAKNPMRCAWERVI